MAAACGLVRTSASVPMSLIIASNRLISSDCAVKQMSKIAAHVQCLRQKAAYFD
ncbi:hypothetical protein RGR602_PB00333 (plasmid) [Rhizobium gallicum bv. gallicum R602sp]|uniref:Uncharacterized protein n=1 Tax=Rhizobium gallicum bv. gallicum R602sp TaxID=1041138 RepID=A0A0B4XBE8_9HYPH|nr:hypothetical protein RGR602_PB00333 [Rhizobium gallicum bv. gallicum R602sp]